MRRLARSFLAGPVLTGLLVAALAGATVGASTVAAGAASDPFAAVTVTGTVGEKPVVAVSKPVSLKKSMSEVLTEGAGDAAKKGDTVTIDYVFVNGRTGAELETSYGTSESPLSLSLTETTQAVIVDNLVGARVGSRVVIGISPREGMSAQLASGTIKKNDTLLFIADIHDLHAPLKRAAGEAVAPGDGLPTVKLAKNGKPTITMPKGDAPTALVAQPLIKGDGPVVQSGQTLLVHYAGAIWSTGKVFDSSWKTGDPFTVPAIGGGDVIAGWDQGLVGQTVGSQVLLVIPPELGYGAQGQPGAGIKGTDTLVFVVDVLDAA